jgi:hypothetical protein
MIEGKISNTIDEIEVDFTSNTFSPQLELLSEGTNI